MRTVATSLDHVSGGRLANSYHVLVQEFTALEQELLKNPVAATHGRLVDSLPESLTSREEVMASNRYEVSQHKLRQARSRGVPRN